MDQGSTQNIRGPKKDPLDTINLGGAQGTRTPVPLHSSTQQRSQHDARRERAKEGKVQSIQRPIYYLSMLLTKSQQRYPHYQKLVYAIIMTSRKVTHYFDEHPITIVSSAPLADILNNPGATGRVAEWNIELSPRDL